MTTKHKFHDEIVAWAAGAEIETFSADLGAWVPCPLPLWSGDQYRVKKQSEYESRDVRVGDVFSNEDETFIVLRLDDDLIPLVLYLHRNPLGKAFGFRHMGFIRSEHKINRLPEVVPGLALLAQSQGYTLEVV